MNKQNIRKLRLIIGSIITVFLWSVAWTNEGVDYLAKLGYTNVFPPTVFLVSAFLAISSLVWLLWEILEG